MKRWLIVGLIVCVGFVLTGWLISPGLANQVDPTSHPGNTVQLNGMAAWATSPTGPDFEGVKLIPFQAQNPSQETFDLSVLQIEPYISPDFYIENIQVSQSGVVSGASHLINDFSEVMVYIDPTDSNHLLGASKFFYYPQSYSFYTGVFESFDGGATWSEEQPTGVENYSMTSDPVTTFDNVGNAFFTLLTRGPTGLDMLKKAVGANGWTQTIVDQTTYTDKQWIMGDQDWQNISPYAGNLYMSWTSFGGPVTGIVFSRSTDGNLTWSPPIALSSGDVQGSVPGVAPDGTVYVVFGRSIFYGGPGTMEIVKSTNGGTSFDAPIVAANITAIPYNLPDPFNHWTNFRSPASLPGFAVSPTNGYLYIVWSDYRNGDADIYLARSVDGGSSWETPVRLNDDPISNGIDQFQPQVTVAQNGRVSVMWFDRRMPCPDLPWIPDAHIGIYNGCIDTFLTRSYDDGTTWTPNARVSNQTWDWTLNLPLDGGGNGFIGDYQGIAANDMFDFPFWNATANLGNNDENYQEVFITRVPVPYYNLSSSIKSVSAATIQPGGTLTYTITLLNTGIDNDPMVMLTDTLPISTTYVEGSLSYPSGSGVYDPDTGVITWTGEVTASQGLEISFSMLANNDLEDGGVITNTAQILDSAGVQYTRVATSTVLLPPVILETLPADGEADVLIDEPIVVTFSEPMDIQSLQYGLIPNPGGLAVEWNDQQTVVTLTHSIFEYSQFYTMTIDAQDLTGLPLQPGQVPNPWSFTTQMGPAPYIILTSPVDGQDSVAITKTLTITFSEPVITSTFQLTLTPPMGDFLFGWNNDSTVVTATPVTTWEYGQVYTIAVAVKDTDGLELVPGPVPNPWSFNTILQHFLQFFIPLLIK